ncbi:MAG: sigma-54-dependent Fis family transcriptional regulator [Desulfatitalea sp.]|nr:sigma-54 dependent transcriptional regulator [Desulfatitalea sp.]NNK00150.1 sigma-54-dependent Fis family transcriptional regulator [Desulfatitalea sp.]
MTQDAAQTKRTIGVLIIDDEENMRHMLSSMLKREGYAVDTAPDGRVGLEKLTATVFDFVLCDIKMPRMDGMAFLKAVRQAGNLGATIIMMSAYGTIDLAVEAMKLGAYDFITKPFKSDEVRLAIKKAEERDRLKQENLQLRARIQQYEERGRFGGMIARSAAMRDVFELAAKVAPYNTTVLIIGESGTGKELVARAIHQNGPRRQMPLVPVNCGGIPDTLLESELFGHTKGAFTGADHARKGLFVEAHGGTIFLDEIGEMPPQLQVKLLRVLQESEVRPVGQAVARQVDVRVVAATSRNLEQMVAEGGFREDLFYRLNVLTIALPPLRDRTEDIPLLCRHFIEQFNATLERQVKGIAPEAMSGLLKHDWPGNVRELENVLERAMVLAEGNQLRPAHFALNLDGAGSRRPVAGVFAGYSIKSAQKIMEKEMIIRALKATESNRTQAARLLEISHPSLLSKMKLYKIDL